MRRFGSLLASPLATRDAAADAMRLPSRPRLVFVVLMAVSSVAASSSRASSSGGIAMDARGASPPSEATSSVAEQCRRESHEALFRARSETVDGDDDSFVCDAVFRDAQLTCRIASATTRCRLSRAGASPRGDCAAMTDCERCVVAELGKGVAYVEDAEPTSSTWSGAAARALAGAFGRVSRASSSSEIDDDDDQAGRIDRNMEWSVHLQEVASVRPECRHAELRWRNERTARALLGIHRAAEAAESESARRFERIAETTIEIAEAVAKTRAAAEALDAKLDVATIRIDDVNDALVAARDAHDAHDAVTRRGFDDVFSAVASAREGVDEIADAIDAAAKTAATLSAHAANANESLNSVRDAVRWLVDSRVTVREQTRRFVSYAAVVAAVVADGRIAALPGVRGRCGESGSGRRGRHDPRLPSRDGHARCRSCLPA